MIHSRLQVFLKELTHMIFPFFKSYSEKHQDIEDITEGFKLQILRVFRSETRLTVYWVLYFTYCKQPDALEGFF